MTPGVSILHGQKLSDECSGVCGYSHLGLEFLHDIQKAVVNIGLVRELHL